MLAPTWKCGALAVLATVTAFCCQFSHAQQAQPIQGQPLQGQSIQGQPAQANAAQQVRVVDPATAVAEGNAEVAAGGAGGAGAGGAGVGAPGAAGAARVIEPPFAALSEAEQKYIDQVLLVWEKSTSQINTFECKFKRWVYNPNAHESQPETISEGEIRYKNPDKGSFKETNRFSLAGSKPDGSPDYKINPRLPHGDWWVCDGEWVHQLDRNEKKAIRTQLPPDLRGNNIPLSPLPFLFGVKANEVKQRYYIRAIAPPQGNNDVWVEAWPKRADDAGNYSRVQIVLDRSDNLPKGMFLFMPNWTPQAKHRELYEFSGKQINGVLDLLKQKLFMQSFIETEVGSDWQVIQEPWIPPQQQPLAPANPQPGQGENRVAAPPQRVQR